MSMVIHHILNFKYIVYLYKKYIFFMLKFFYSKMLRPGWDRTMDQDTKQSYYNTNTVAFSWMMPANNVSIAHRWFLC